MGNRQRVIVVGIAVGLSGVAAAAELHVPSEYPTIQHAIIRAVDGDEVVVAPGTYNETFFFNGFDITLRSSGGRDVTIVSGAGLGATPIASSTLDETIVIEGFTFRQSSAPYAVDLESTAATVRDCLLTMNRGGLSCDGPLELTDCEISHGTEGGLLAEDLIVRRCQFIDNGSPLLESGGVCTLGGTIDDSTFIGNRSKSGGGISHTVAYFAGGLLSVTNCVFSNNRGEEGGGAIHAINTSGGAGRRIADCIFTNNSTGDAGVGGGAIYCQSGLALINCLLAMNSSQVRGGAVSGGGSFYNCTVTGNESPINGGITGGATIYNSVVWNNGSDPIGAGTFTIDHSCIEFGWPGMTDSIIDDPEFVDADYRIGVDSPCANSGDDGHVPFGVKTDLDGAERFVGTVDMGAYEFQGESAGACCLNDGSCLSVSEGYCGVIAGTFQGIGVTCTDAMCPPPTPQCDSDISGDGIIGFDDILRILSDWGPCPE